VKADRYGVVESQSTELLHGKKQDDGKVTFKCRVTRYDDTYTLLAKILKNDSTVHIVRPGIRLALADGDTVVLQAVRPAACCSSWADGRWYNASFRLDPADVRKLMETGIRSITITSHSGEISREIAPGREMAIAELLQSVRED